MNVSSEKIDLNSVQLATRADLRKPIDISRNISLTWLFSNLSRGQFKVVIDALAQGSIQSEGYSGWLDPNNPFHRMHRDKLPLMASDWSDYCLRYPDSGGSGPLIHLIDNVNERAIVDITLSTSQANRALKLTGQNGGQPPKMGPRLYAWLTAWYAHDDLPSDPTELFAIVSEVPELWETGEIDDPRGLTAITSFLRWLKEFDQRTWPPEEVTSSKLV